MTLFSTRSVERRDACLEDYCPPGGTSIAAGATPGLERVSGSPPDLDWVNVESRFMPEADTQGNVRAEDRVQKLEAELSNVRERYDEVELSRQQLQQYCQRLVEDMDSMTPNPPSLAAVRHADLQSEVSKDAVMQTDLGTDHWQRRCFELEHELLVLRTQQKDSSNQQQRQDQQQVTTHDLVQLMQQLNLYKEDFRKEKTERENLTSEVSRLNSEWTQIRRERDESNRQKTDALKLLTDVKEELSEVKEQKEKAMMERGVLLRQFAKLRAAQTQRTQPTTTPKPQMVVAQTGSASGEPPVSQTVTREQMPFDLRWTCKACTFVNRRMISACEVCATKTELPMYIDGYEVTTPTELKNRKEKKGTKSFVLINPASTD